MLIMPGRDRAFVFGLAGNAPQSVASYYQNGSLRLAIWYLALQNQYPNALYPIPTNLSIFTFRSSLMTLLYKVFDSPKDACDFVNLVANAVATVVNIVPDNSGKFILFYTT